MTTDRSVRPEKIALADFHAVVAQDAVGGGGMEIEIRKRKGRKKLLALDRHGIAAADRKRHLAAVAALELRRLERFYVIDRLRQPLLQFIERLFGVGCRRHFAVRDARTGLRREIAGELDLARQWQHIRI